MFGYIRPLQGELKVRELERYKACYCGLCHSLGRQYGLVSRFFLSHELVFLAMLLWKSDEAPVFSRKRCIASPFRSKRSCEGSEALDMSAAYNVILSWWKLRDSISDESFFKSIPHRFASFFLRRAYLRASREFPSFSSKVREQLLMLAEYEMLDDCSLDCAADKFAMLLCAALPDTEQDFIRMPMQEVLYHLGRWVYIIDACDDLGDDIRFGKYNAIARLFPLGDEKMPDDVVNRLETTLRHSNNLIGLAIELLPNSIWSEILKNMVYLGMPEESNRVCKKLSLVNLKE